LPVEHPQHGRLVSFVLPISLGIALAIVMTWPLVLYLGSDVPAEYGDPFFDAWQVAWIGHALLNQPLDLFQANRFWPEQDTLAFTDVMLGYAPAGILAAASPRAALVVHNVLVLFAFALAFIGAYLLARELGTRWPGAIAAGAAFAYAPWRLSQVRHLSVLSSGGIPLALFLLVRGYRRGSARWVLAGWLVAAWQMTLGFSLGIQFGYLLLVLGVIAGVYWLLRGRPRIAGGVARATAVGICLLALVVGMQSRPYFRVAEAHPEAKRTPDLVAWFSPPPSGFLSAPAESYLWGDATADTRNSFEEQIEQNLFPGIAIVLLALVGLASKVYPAGLRIGLATGVVITGVLSLGLPSYADGGEGFTPYRLLYEFAPGWDSIRTPGRLHTLTSLGLALLAGAGLCLVVRVVRNSLASRKAGRGPAAAVTASALVAVILLEGFGPIPHWPAPSVPQGQAAAPPPQFHLPTDWTHDLVYTYWSTDGFPAIVNGPGSFFPRILTTAQSVARTFPDAASVEYLRRLGVRSVILHPGLAAGTPWQDASLRPIGGLPLRREIRADVILYHLQPMRPAKTATAISGRARGPRREAAGGRRAR
jgi:hypothetical protein